MIFDRKTYNDSTHNNNEIYLYKIITFIKVLSMTFSEIKDNFSSDPLKPKALIEIMICESYSSEKL